MTSQPATSPCPPGTGPRWPASWPPAPRIVAESLEAVADPLRTGLACGPTASGAEVARALARTLPAAEWPCAPPPWLLPGQCRSFRRVLAALTRYGGALVADPVGSGKTYVALAVASTWRRPAACLVPATLAAQWSDVAARLAVPVEIVTHQQASRGRLPGGRARLVIIDESHHFRNPRTHRYRHLAPWLVGRQVLLLTATPIVNHAEDLAHQLLLGVRDDALIADGVVSLRAVLVDGNGTPALGRLVVEDTSEAGPRPARTPTTSAPALAEEESARRLIQRLGRLRLSRHPATAALIRGVLLRAAASSPAALTGALRRYRSLLLHGRDAHCAGRSLSRAELREFAGELDDQLVLWELVGDRASEPELALEDLDAIGEVMAESAAPGTEPDLKLERLRALLADGRPTLVFTTRRDTVRHLRDRAGSAVAWCTGDRSGLGHAPAARSVVMSWFRDNSDGAPRCLVTTDVAAEGLDLRRAERVVHYDLPWTPMRIEQREGRAVRLGSLHPLIEVVRFPPPAPIEAALRLTERLERKAALPGRAGLGPDGVRLWRWRSVLADRVGGGSGVLGTALVRATGSAGVLAGFTLVARVTEGPEPLASTVGWLDPDGRWSEDGDLVGERLLEAARSEACLPVRPDTLRSALDRLVIPIRARLALAGGRRWSAAEPTRSARCLAERLDRVVAEAVRARDRRRLEQLERAMGFASGGHTAGEAMLVDCLAGSSPKELAAWVSRAPAPTRRWDAIEVRLTGVVLFEP